MNELPDAAKAVLHQARSAHDPGALDCDRSLARLHESLSFDLELPDVDLAEGTLGQPGLSAAAKSTALLSAKGMKLYLVVAALGGTLGAALWLPNARTERVPQAARVTQRTESAPAAPATDTQVAVPEAPQLAYGTHSALDKEALDAAPAESHQVALARTSSSVRSRITTPRTARRARSAEPVVTAAAAEPVQSEAATPAPDSPRVEVPVAEARKVESELALIDRAATSLRDHQPGSALTALDEHLALYPAGVLRSERQGLRVLALCAAGRTEQGRREQATFLAHAGKTPLATRVRNACSESSP